MAQKNTDLKIDIQFKSLIPPLSKEEYDTLEKSIIEEGCRDPLVLWNGIILDGHNRYDICMKNGIIFKTVEKNFDSRDDAKIWILNNQLGRRNLNDAQRIDVVDKLFGLQERQKAKERKDEISKLPPETRGKFATSLDTGKTRDKLGEKAKVSGRQYDKGIKIKETNPELWEKCKSGEISIDRAIKEIKNEEVKEKIEKQKEEIRKGLEEPNGLYDIIVIDPPWHYGRKYDSNAGRSASKYPEMTFEELELLELPAKDDCILWCWTTHQFIYDAIELLEKWGFDYKGILVWDKEKMGMGNWLRLQTEFCLLGIKGKPLWENKNIRDILREPRTEHSVKPDGFYKMIDENFIGKKLDYFGRKKREGWDTYGAGQNSI